MENLEILLRNELSYLDQKFTEDLRIAGFCTRGGQDPTIVVDNILKRIGLIFFKAAVTESSIHELVHNFGIDDEWITRLASATAVESTYPGFICYLLDTAVSSEGISYWKTVLREMKDISVIEIKEV